MPDRKQYLKDFSKKYYAEKADVIAYNRLIKRIAAGGKPKLETLQRFNLTQADVDNTRRAPENFPTGYRANNIQIKPEEVYLPDPNKGIYTINDVRECLDDVVAKKKIKPRTANNYITKLGTIKDWLNCGADLIKCLEDPAEVINAVNENTTNVNSKKDMYSSIVSAAKHCPRIKQALERNNSFTAYKREMDKYLKRAEKKREDDTELKNAVPWQKLLDKVTQIKNKYGEDSQNHILARLYTDIPAIRDNYGSIWVKPMTKKINPKSRELLEADPPKMPTAAEGVLYHNATTAVIALHDYKTAGNYGRVMVLLPNSLQKAIIRSLKKEPREWLITNAYGKRADKLSGRIKRLFGGHGINDIRHSAITYHMRDLQKLSVPQRKALAEKMMHSVNVQSYYVRSNAIENEIKEEAKKMLK